MGKHLNYPTKRACILRKTVYKMKKQSQSPTEYDKKVKLRVWKGTLVFTDRGHPLGDSRGVVIYHRHMASLKIGRWLEKRERVFSIDGNRRNCAMSNLRVTMFADKICEACGATFEIPSWQSSRKYCSHPCGAVARRKSERPTAQVLTALLEEFSIEEIGRRYGVGGKAIRRWAESLGIDWYVISPFTNR